MSNIYSCPIKNNQITTLPRRIRLDDDVLHLLDNSAAKHKLSVRPPGRKRSGQSPVPPEASSPAPQEASTTSEE